MNNSINNLKQRFLLTRSNLLGISLAIVGFIPTVTLAQTPDRSTRTQLTAQTVVNPEEQLSVPPDPQQEAQLEELRQRLIYQDLQRLERRDLLRDDLRQREIEQRYQQSEFQWQQELDFEQRNDTIRQQLRDLRQQQNDLGTVFD